MKRTTDEVALNYWYAIGRIEDVVAGRQRDTYLLGQNILAQRNKFGSVEIHELESDGTKGTVLPTQERYGHIWTTLGSAPKDLFSIPEFDQPDRRFVSCGVIRVATSAPRVIENFLDISHLPFVHEGILGEEPHTRVENYQVELRSDPEEIWASGIKFYQPMASLTAEDAAQVEYIYRAPQPFSVVLYKTCAARANEMDVIGVFTQPLNEELCDVHSFVLAYDEHSTDIEIMQFQQNIFIQDRRILENQLPKRVPLFRGTEIPIKADASSRHYRQWLRDLDLHFGVIREQP